MQLYRSALLPEESDTLNIFELTGIWLGSTNFLRPLTEAGQEATFWGSRSLNLAALRSHLAEELMIPERLLTVEPQIPYDGRTAFRIPRTHMISRASHSIEFLHKTTPWSESGFLPSEKETRQRHHVKRCSPMTSLCFFSHHLRGEFVEGMRIFDSTPTMLDTSKFLMSSANPVLCIYRRATSPGSSPAA